MGDRATGRNVRETGRIDRIQDPLVCPPKPTNSSDTQAPQFSSQPPPADPKGKRPMVAETLSPLVSSPPVEVEDNPNSVEVLLKGAKVTIDKSSWELFKSTFDAADYVLIDPLSTEGDKGQLQRPNYLQLAREN
ncbi:uncharacterized protein A4U43_C07F25230 [Asparagus officinalis]|uniref:Uncharacterized protein n=1 Tax=Asparagus officinalis TaxID=4686 RepID=A0A5P1EF29_ASPOF|nr:uncharacterized protein A4U43_C07F25230 [Asparagus officinalis]